MASRKKTVKFQVGDRVAERPKDNRIFCINKGKIPVAAKHSTQRIGTVLEITAKRDVRKHLCFYYRVRWDNNTTSQHAQFRLCREDELPDVLAHYRPITTNDRDHD